MKVQSEKTGKSEYTLTIEVEKERIEAALHQAARQLSKRARIPGFRPGKAPYPVVERHLGKDYLYSQAVENIGQELYEEALKETNLDPFAQGNLDIATTQPLVLKAVVPVMPTVTLGDYKSVRVDAPQLDFNEEAVETMITQMREQHAEWSPVDRPAQDDDQATLDLEARVGEQKVMSQPSRRTMVYAEMYPRGLYEKLIGAKAGDVLDYEVDYPADDINKNLAGKTASFHVQVLGVNERHLPELNDEFAKTLGEYESLADLRVRVREQLTKQKEDEIRSKLEDLIVSQIVEKSTLEYPAVAVEKEVERTFQNMRQELAMQGLSWEAYLKAVNKTDAQLREESRPDAEKTVQHTLVLGEIAKVEDVQVSDADIDAEVAKLARSFGGNAESTKELLNRPENRASISSRVRLSKSLDKLIAYASGEALAAEAAAPTEPAEAAAAAAEETTTAS